MWHLHPDTVLHTTRCQIIKLQYNYMTGEHRIQLRIIKQLIYEKISLCHKITDKKPNTNKYKFRMESNVELALAWEPKIIISLTQKILPSERFQKGRIFWVQEERTTKNITRNNYIVQQVLWLFYQNSITLLSLSYHFLSIWRGYDTLNIAFLDYQQSSMLLKVIILSLLHCKKTPLE